MPANTLSRLRTEIGYTQLNRQLEQRDEERNHAKSFPVNGKEIAQHVQAALRPQLAQLSDRIAAEAFIDELAAFAEEFAVKIERVDASLSPLQQGTSGGMYRFGVQPGVLSLMLRRGQYGPRLLVKLTFPPGSAASHRHERIADIIKKLRVADEVRSVPRLATAPSTAAQSERLSTKGKTAEELRAEKQRRVEFCVTWIASQYNERPFKLSDAIAGLRTNHPEMFPTEHYTRAALEQMYRRLDPYVKTAAGHRNGYYQMNEHGLTTASELRERARRTAGTKEAFTMLFDALDEAASAP